MTILYEDKDIVVFEKRPGMDSEKITAGDLYAETDAGRKLYCVHRLDRETGGVTVAAKSAEAAALLMKEFQEGMVEKEYLALAEGKVEPEAGALQDLLFHDIRKNKTYVVKRLRKGVKEAKLVYETMGVCQVNDRLVSLLKVQLVTGRTHQIRVQFASRKHPLVGDSRYGSRQSFDGIGLWSYGMKFVHPITGQVLQFTSVPEWECLKEEAAWLRMKEGI